MYTTEFCRQAWEQSAPACTKEQRIKNNLRWVRYWDHIAARHAKGGGFSDSFPKHVVQRLQDEEILNADAHVLDIGCGSGAYTLDLAKACKGVTAMDMSEKMLEVLRARSSEQGHEQIHTVNSMWESYDSPKKFDLVFTAMCPAICDPESLMKMEQHSKGYCCIVTVGSGSKSELRSNLRKLLTQERLTGLSSDVIYLFNYLYSMGRLPNIRFDSFTSHPKMTVAEAYETYRIYYSIFGLEGQQTDQIILDYLQSIAVDGMCSDHVTYNMSTLWWKV